MAVIFSIAQPVTRIISIADNPAQLGPGQYLYAALAFACYLPIQIWLVLSLARGHRGWPQRMGLAAMATLIFAAMPLVGVGWVGMIDMLAGLTLVMLRPPWLLVGAAAILAAPTVLTSALGQPAFALYLTMGVLIWPLPLAAIIRAIDTARQLQRARVDLAQRAVVRERLRIDRELAQTVGGGLDAIATSADKASRLAPKDPTQAARELKALVKNARSTLSQARQSVRRYRERSPRGELNTAVSLLEAAGVTVQLDLPSDDLPAQVDEREHGLLRHEITRLLTKAVPARVTIQVDAVEGRIHYKVSSVPNQASARVSPP